VVDNLLILGGIVEAQITAKPRSRLFLQISQVKPSLPCGARSRGNAHRHLNTPPRHFHNEERPTGHMKPGEQIA